MLIKYEPAQIKLFKAFPVKDGEIRVVFTAENEEAFFIYKRLIVKNSQDAPIAEARLVCENSDDYSTDFLEISHESNNVKCSIVLSEEALNEASLDEEYSFVIECVIKVDDLTEPNFAWSSTILDNLEIFKNWEGSEENIALLQNICDILPENIENIYTAPH